MAISVNQNGHFEEMGAWFQILQIVGTFIFYLIFDTHDTHDSPGSVFIWIWNCGKNLSQISLCVVEVKTDHSIPQPRVLDTLLVYPKTTLPDNRTSRAIFWSKHVVWVSTLFASCECYLLKSAWVKESAQAKLLLIFQSFGFGFCGFFPGSKSAQAKDWVHRFID